jgi:hypothetical protein
VARISRAVLVGLQEPHPFIRIERTHSALVGICTTRTTGTGDRGRIWRCHGRAAATFRAPLHRADRAASPTAALPLNMAAALHTTDGCPPVQLRAPSEVGIGTIVLGDAAIGSHLCQLLSVCRTGAPCQKERRTGAVLRRLPHPQRCHD